MAKDKNIRKKTRFNPYKNWEHDCESFSDYRNRMSAEYEVDPPKAKHKRKKKKNVLLLVNYAGAPRWWSLRKGWHVHGRYERMRDAKKALKAMEKSWWNKNYSFKIEDTRNNEETNRS